MQSNFRVFLYGITSLVYVFILLTVGNYLLSHVPIGSGFQDGYVVDLKEQGVFNKTVDGKLLLPSIQSASVDYRKNWEFSLDKSVLMSASSALENGKKVRLHYKKVIAPDFVGGSSTNIVHMIEALPE